MTSHQFSADVQQKVSFLRLWHATPCRSLRLATTSVQRPQWWRRVRAVATWALSLRYGRSGWTTTRMILQPHGYGSQLNRLGTAGFSQVPCWNGKSCPWWGAFQLIKSHLNREVVADAEGFGPITALASGSAEVSGVFCLAHFWDFSPEGAMGQNPVPPVNIPIPTKIDQHGWCTYPKMVPLVLNHGHISWKRRKATSLRALGL